jgi:hypothetical protein
MPKDNPNVGHSESVNELLFRRPTANVPLRKQHIAFAAPHLP